MWDIALKFVPVVISVGAVLFAFLIWRANRKATADFAWHLEYQAFRTWELEANTEAFMKIHGITHDDLRCHGLDPETFRAYLLWLNTLWAAAQNMRGIRKIRRTSNYRRKVALAAKHTWSPESRSGRILRSQAFRAAWPLLGYTWNRGPKAVLAPLVEAALRECEENPSGYRTRRELLENESEPRQPNKPMQRTGLGPGAV